MLLKHSDEFKDIASALSRAQGMFKVARRETLNPFLKTNYADIKSVREASFEGLSKNELAIVQTHHQDVDEQGFAAGPWKMVTTLIHSSGQWFETDYPMHVNKADAQGFAAATTYARRVSWTTICGIVSENEDDDGNENTEGETGTVGQGAIAAAQEAAAMAARGAGWAKTQQRAIAKMMPKEIDAWKELNAKNLGELFKHNSGAHEDLMRAVSERKIAFAAPEIDTPKPTPIEQPQHVLDDPIAEKFQKRLDDLHTCDDDKEVDELDESVMAWLNTTTAALGFMERWAVAVSTRRRTIKSRRVTAQKGAPSKL